MALVEQRVLDKIEIVGKFKHVQIRDDDQIIDDQTNEVKASGNWHRRVLTSNEDISSESAEVQAVCNAVWTDEVKAAWSERSKEINEL
jgi:hypothetical protein